MKVYFLAGILLFCFLTLDDSEAFPLKTEIVKVGRDCKTSGLQPKDGSICLKLTVVAGISVNVGLGYEEKDKKKNNQNGSGSDKNEDGKQNQRQEEMLNKDRGWKQEQQQQKRNSRNRMKNARIN